MNKKKFKNDQTKLVSKMESIANKSLLVSSALFNKKTSPIFVLSLGLFLFLHFDAVAASDNDFAEKLKLMTTSEASRMAAQPPAVVQSSKGEEKTDPTRSSAADDDLKEKKSDDHLQTEARDDAHNKDRSIASQSPEDRLDNLKSAPTAEEIENPPLE